MNRTLVDGVGARSNTSIRKTYNLVAKSRLELEPLGYEPYVQPLHHIAIKLEVTKGIEPLPSESNSDVLTVTPCDNC